MINRINEFVRHRLLGTNDFKMFVIISRPRSGSTWLVTLLNSHPNCITRGELFRHPTGSDAKSMYYRQFHRKWTRKVELVGFKIFYHHPLASDDKTVWELIAKDPTIKIVRLERRDKFRIYLSQQIGNKNNQWILRDKNERVKQKLHIDIDDLKYFLEENEQLEKLKHFTDLYKTHQVYEIYYEDLVAQTKE